MAKLTNRLNDLQVRALSKPGRYADGQNLYLNISAKGAKSWVFLYALAGKQREMGLGPLSTFGIAAARNIASVHREVLGGGRDPITARDEAAAAAAKAERDTAAKPTFGEYAIQYIGYHETQWSNKKHRAQWRTSLTTHAATLWEMKIDKITKPDVLACLKPIWNTIPETASRVQGRIKTILDAAIAEELIPGPNPAHWADALKPSLKAVNRLQRGHHPAMDYEDLPAFIVRLQARQSVGSLALEMLILCASRTSEILEMTWEEIDLATGVWIIPAPRMKRKKEHRVPLTDRTLAILEKVKPLAMAGKTEVKARKGEEPSPTGIVFRGSKGGALSNMTLKMHLRRRGRGDVCPHGFRSSFRDWAGNVTNHPRDVAELALAHAIGDAVERAYRRSDAIEKRRLLMRDWEAFTQSMARETIKKTVAAILLAVAGGNIVPITAAKA
jgi:integrase